MAGASEIRVNTELTPDERHALDLTEELANVLKQSRRLESKPRTKT